ncbi:MAG: hypothetical protein ABEH58_01840 [Haloplanus sp.]
MSVGAVAAGRRSSDALPEEDGDEKPHRNREAEQHHAVRFDRAGVTGRLRRARTLAATLANRGRVR